MKRFVLLLALFASFAFAQKDIVISPQSIVVNPLPSFDVEVFVDKDTSGETIPTYEIGEAIRIGVRVSEDSYVYLFNVRSNGDIQQIIPNRLDDTGRRNFVEAGTTRYFPRQDARYTFNIAGPRGPGQGDRGSFGRALEHLAAYPFRRRERLCDLGSRRGFLCADALYRGAALAARGLGHGHGPFLCRTRCAPEPVRNHQRNVGATWGGGVCRWSSFVGYTPVRFGTRAGQHTVRLELDGYETFQDHCPT